jgi:hypothetical protein
MPQTKQSESLSLADQRRLCRAGLSQSVAAETLGVTSPWLRNREGSIARNPDGTYPLRELIAWFVNQSPPAMLADQTGEQLLQASGRLARGIDHSVAGLAGVLRGIIDEHGGRGAAAVGEAVVVALEARVAADDDPKPLTDDQIWAAVQAEFDLRRRFRDHAAARAACRVVAVCPECDRYRLNGRWRDGSPPAGWAVEGETCPGCQSK